MMDNIDETCVAQLLDKLIIRQLHLIEDRMQCELNIESSVKNGSFHLAKSRYIMGQNSVSATRLPIETSNEFSASALCETIEEYGVKKLKVIENKEKIVNPMRWFGVLVPQNLHKAQNIFQNAINYVVECVNIQLQIHENCKHIELLKIFSKQLK